MCKIVRPECIVCGWLEGCLFTMCDMAHDWAHAFNNAQQLEPNVIIWCSEPPVVPPPAKKTFYVCIPCRYEAHFLSRYQRTKYGEQALDAVAARCAEREVGGPARPFNHTSLREMAPFTNLARSKYNLEPIWDVWPPLSTHWQKQQYKMSTREGNWGQAAKIYEALALCNDDEYYWESRAKLADQSEIVGSYTNCKKYDGDREQTYEWTMNQAAIDQLGNILGRGFTIWVRAKNLAEENCKCEVEGNGEKGKKRKRDQASG